MKSDDLGIDRHDKRDSIDETFQARGHLPCSANMTYREGRSAAAGVFSGRASEDDPGDILQQHPGVERPTFYILKVLSTLLTAEDVAEVRLESWSTSRAVDTGSWADWLTGCVCTGAGGRQDDSRSEHQHHQSRMMGIQSLLLTLTMPL